MGVFSEYRAECPCGGYASFQWGSDWNCYSERHQPPQEDVADLIGQTGYCNQCDRTVKLVMRAAIGEEWSSD